MKKTKFSNSQISEVGYVAETKQLLVVFKSGDAHVYLDVAEVVYKNITTDVSKSKYFDTYVKENYKYAPIDDHTLKNFHICGLHNINLCDTCSLSFAVCPKGGMTFGDGVGSDNVIGCLNYTKTTNH